MSISKQKKKKIKNIAHFYLWNKHKLGADENEKSEKKKGQKKKKKKKKACRR